MKTAELTAESVKCVHNPPLLVSFPLSCWVFILHLLMLQKAEKLQFKQFCVEAQKRAGNVQQCTGSACVYMCVRASCFNRVQQ